MLNRDSGARGGESNDGGDNGKKKHELPSLVRDDLHNEYASGFHGKDRAVNPENDEKESSAVVEGLNCYLLNLSTVVSCSGIHKSSKNTYDLS